MGVAIGVIGVIVFVAIGGGGEDAGVSLIECRAHCLIIFIVQCYGWDEIASLAGEGYVRGGGREC